MALTAQQLAKLSPRVWAGEGTATFALLDGAASPTLLDQLYDAPGLEFECLYSGELEPDIAEVAPYIARVEAGSAFADWVLGLWGERRAILVQVDVRVELPVLRRHFRKLNLVYGPDAAPLLLRYYDPRVLPLFLSTCDRAQVREMFGPVIRFVLEGASGGQGLALSAPAGELVQEAFSVA
ncbi:MAG: DUF4123 domain-containing protein [Pseudomonadota bacterium]